MRPQESQSCAIVETNLRFSGIEGFQGFDLDNRCCQDRLNSTVSRSVPPVHRDMEQSAVEVMQRQIFNKLIKTGLDLAHVFDHMPGVWKSIKVRSSPLEGLALLLQFDTLLLSRTLNAGSTKPNLVAWRAR